MLTRPKLLHPRTRAIPHEPSRVVKSPLGSFATRGPADPSRRAVEASVFRRWVMGQRKKRARAFPGPDDAYDPVAGIVAFVTLYYIMAYTSS